jgi:hypothetical protein
MEAVTRARMRPSRGSPPLPLHTGEALRRMKTTLSVPALLVAPLACALAVLGLCHAP